MNCTSLLKQWDACLCGLSQFCLIGWNLIGGLYRKCFDTGCLESLVVRASVVVGLFISGLALCYRIGVGAIDLRKNKRAGSGSN